MKVLLLPSRAPGGGQALDECLRSEESELFFAILATKPDKSLLQLDFITPKKSYLLLYENECFSTPILLSFFYI